LRKPKMTMAELRTQKQAMLERATFGQDRIYQLPKRGPLGLSLTEDAKIYRAGEWKELTDGITHFYSGFPITREALKNTIEDGQKLLRKFWWKPTITEDIGIWKESVSLPHWLAKKHPQIDEVYKIQTARQDARAELLHGHLEGIEDFLKLKKDDYELCKKLLLKGDETGKTWTKEELLNAGTSELVADAYRGVRETLSSILGDYWKRMKEWGIPDDEIQQFRQQIGSIVGYFPRVRMGKYFVRATKEGEPAIRKHFNNPIQGA
ncbi:unnamed protein product, partial [marine sediment metagenome]